MEKVQKPTSETEKYLPLEWSAKDKERRVANCCLVQQTIWFGGSESHTFNRLEEIAMSEYPVTPVLGRQLTHTHTSPCCCTMYTHWCTVAESYVLALLIRCWGVWSSLFLWSRSRNFYAALTSAVRKKSKKKSRLNKCYTSLEWANNVKERKNTNKLAKI